jgi:hypothetical protein
VLLTSETARSYLHRLNEHEHAPTGEQQVCKKCRGQLPARWFALQPRNLSGRAGSCLVCWAALKRILRRRERTSPQQKECRQCRHTLPAASLSREPYTPDGLQTICKNCTREYNQKRTRALTEVTVPSQYCCVCKMDKPAAAFHMMRKHTTGLASECKECKRKFYQQQKQQQQQTGSTSQKAAAAGAFPEGAAVVVAGLCRSVCRALIGGHLRSCYDVSRSLCR